MAAMKAPCRAHVDDQGLARSACELDSRSFSQHRAIQPTSAAAAAAAAAIGDHLSYDTTG